MRIRGDKDQARKSPLEPPTIGWIAPVNIVAVIVRLKDQIKRPNFAGRRMVVPAAMVAALAIAVTFSIPTLGCKGEFYGIASR